MPVNHSLAYRLGQEAPPTLGQALLALLFAGLIVLFSFGQGLTKAFGITPAGVEATSSSFLTRFQTLLASTITEHIVLIAFWSVVGLVAYLVCWGVYSAFVETRNEVTVEREYTNRGQRGTIVRELAIKLASAAVLVVSLVLLGLTLSSLLAAIRLGISGSQVSTIGLAAAGFLLLAAEIYFVFFGLLLAFTPWYRAESFTD